MTRRLARAIRRNAMRAARSHDRARLRNRIESHIERHLGPVRATLRGPVFAGVRVDLLWVAPTPANDFHTLITCGMALRPMPMPPTPCGCSPYAELLLRLPAEWSVGPDASHTDEATWPLTELMHVARIPHLDATHFGAGHTVTLVDAPTGAVHAMGPTGFCGCVLREPDWTPTSFRQLRLTLGDRLHFLSVIPLYEGELVFAHEQGGPALLDCLDSRGVTDLVVVDRPSVFTVIH